MQRGATVEDITALHKHGITVDNEDPDEANVAPPPAQPIQETWGRPAICARRAKPNLTDFQGGWKNYAWNAIKDQTYFDTFRVCFLEKYVVKVFLPETNKHLKKDLTLQEFYVFLGCQIFMA